MRIAYILPALSNKGSIMLFKDLVDNLFEGNQIDIFYFKESEEKIDFKTKPQKINLYTPILFEDYDLVHSSGIIPDTYVALWSFLYKFEKVTTIHSYIEKDLAITYNPLASLIFSKIWRFIWKRMDRIYVLSKDAKEYYSTKILKEKIEVVHSGRTISLKDLEINKNHEKMILELKKKYKIIGSNAILTKIKGLEHIIKFLIRDKNYLAVIIGDGKEKENLIELAKKNKVIDRCLFLGYQYGAHKYIKYYDIYAMPSRSEGFGLALIEAAILKKPTICSNIKIFKEIFSENQVSFFDLDNDDSFELAVRNIEDNYNMYSENIYNKYINNYTAEKMSERYLEKYLNLIGRN